MPTHVVLLRGVNVGAATRVPMAGLREVMAALGHDDVATYIQSGNVVFTTTERDPRAVGDAITAAVEKAFDVRSPVVVLTRDELAQVVADNPYPDEADGARLHAVFLLDAPTTATSATVEEAQQRAAAKGSTDTASLVGRILYLHTPAGFGRSELAAALTRSTPASARTAGTARNWRTVTRLLQMLDG